VGLSAAISIDCARGARKPVRPLRRGVACCRVADVPIGMARPYPRTAKNAMVRRQLYETTMPPLIPDLSVILAFALATVVLAITPGPDMALQLSRAINYGRSHGLAAMFGAMAGIVVHTTLVAFGISVLIIAAPPLFMALTIAGALYLLWLA